MSRSVAGSSGRLRTSPASSLLRKHRAPIGFTAFLLFLGAINLYVLYYRHDTSVPALLELANAGRRAALGTHTRLIGPPGTPPVPVRQIHHLRTGPLLPDYPRVVEVPLKVGDTVSAVLRSRVMPNSLSGPLLDELQSSLRSLLDPGGLGVGQTFTFYYDLDERLVAVDYRLTDSSAFHLERVATGSTERFVSSRQEQPLVQKVATVAVVLDHPGDLVSALVRAGEQPALAARLGEVFACETGLFTDTQAGDRIRLVVEKQLLGGSLYRYGRLLAAEYQPAPRPGSARPARPERADRPLRAFLEPNTGSLGAAGAAPGAALHYYSESGDSLARALCRAPLLYGKAPGGLADPATARPISHVEHGRLGLDYPAPVGTPVVSAGSGKVASIVRGSGEHGQSGHTVVITHPGGLETTYQNLGRLARGLAEGQPVRLRQVIGYVGQPAGAGAVGHAAHGAQSGGALHAPRPHLHFALRVAGKPVDPGKWKSPREAALPAPQRASFSEQVTELMERMAQAEPSSDVQVAAAPGR